jgi:Rrf2 family protein
MNMTLSKRGDYVMRAAIFLASAPAGESRKIREIVADTEVPPAFASQILADLVRAGLATSKAGRDGGYQLSRDPSHISALEIVEAAEGPLAAERCALSEGPCKWESVCPLHETWFEATQHVRELLGATTLAELATRDREISEGTYAPKSTHRRNPLQVEISDSVQIERSAGDVTAALGSSKFDINSLIERAIDDDSRVPGDIIDGALQPIRSAGSNQPKGFQAVWRLRNSDRAFHVEADLEILAVDADRCEANLRVLWHEEAARATAAEVKRRANKIVRAFLREMATSVETEIGVSA